MNRASEEFMEGFSKRRKLFWYLCMLPASVIGTLFYVFPTVVWLVPIPPALMLVLAIGEFVRYRRRRPKKPDR